MNLYRHWNFYKFLRTKHRCSTITIPFLMESITCIMCTNGITWNPNLNFQTVFIFMINTFSQKLFRMVSLLMVTKSQMSNYKMTLFAKGKWVLTIKLCRFRLLNFTKNWSVYFNPRFTLSLSIKKLVYSLFGIKCSCLNIPPNKLTSRLLKEDNFKGTICTSIWNPITKGM